MIFSRSYYLLVGLSPEGHLIFQEDREGSVVESIVKKKSFINGARHSVYYKRYKDEAVLLVDREVIQLNESKAEVFVPTQDIGQNEILIGGQSTTDPRFAIYKGYSGCLSSKRKSFFFRKFVI